MSATKEQKQARHYQCMICKRFIVAYGEHIPGAADLCESQDCLIAWSLISEDARRFLLCHCRSFTFSHLPEAHKKLRSDLDWRTPEERNIQYQEDYFA